MRSHASAQRRCNTPSPVGKPSHSSDTMTRYGLPLTVFLLSLTWTSLKPKPNTNNRQGYFDTHAIIQTYLTSRDTTPEPSLFRFRWSFLTIISFMSWLAQAGQWSRSNAGQVARNTVSVHKTNQVRDDQISNYQTRIMTATNESNKAES